MAEPLGTLQQEILFDDMDISALLEELLQDTADGINDDDKPDGDVVMGSEEIDEYILGGVDQPEPAPPAKFKPKRPIAAPKKYPAEPIADIDPSITLGDMMAIIFAEIRRKGIAGHHISSMNSFYGAGIKQIVTKVFAVEGRMKNLRDKTDEDRDITEISFRVDFTDINLLQPTTTKYRSGTSQMLTPTMARTKNLTYSADMMMDAQITATAIHKNGATKTRTAEISNLRIASIPCQVGTELCNTYNCSKETLKKMEEDPLNPGGYFIIKGFEWTIDSLENITNNTFHVHKNMHQNEIARGTFLSKPGVDFENSYQVLLRYLNTGAITMEITTNKFDKFEIPYYLIFRALGMTSDRDIINRIVYGVDIDTPVIKMMLEILGKTFDAPDDKFGPIRRSTNPVEIIQFIAQRITETANAAVIKKDDNVAKYLNNNILNIIDRYIFPHIGTGIEHRIRKLDFFGHLINKLLSVVLEITESTDRDSYKNKRVFTAGTSVAKTFKTDFNFVVVQEIKKRLMRDFRMSPFSQVPLAESVKAAINSDDLERLLTQAITTGNKTITVRRNEITNRISSQMLYHKNDLNVKSTLNTINTPNTSASKQNERADEMRRVHPTNVGFVDVSQSADTGEKVGMTKQMACTASVCGASSGDALKRTLLEDEQIIHLDDIQPEHITIRKLSKVFVNGDWIGCCEKSHELARQYRIRRRYEDIHYQTTIVWEPLVREIYFWTDVGRLMRPLVIVYNNIEQYIDNWRNGDKSMKFKQWVKLTRQHILDLQSKKKTMDDLRRERIIEYISPEEQENTLIAQNLDVLRAQSDSIQRMFTHCDIDQAIFGVVTLATPLANHSNAVRNTMFTNHRKQSAGWFAFNFAYRIDKNTTLQHYCEWPLISVIADAFSYPNGHNSIILLALHGGFNQEDSITVNRSSVDCGMYNASHYNYEKAELDKGEQFGNPDYARTMDIKKGAIYEYVKDGFITPGTRVKKGYVLVVKVSKIQKPVDQYQYVDNSVVYKRDEEVVVSNVVVTRNDEDVVIAKVGLRADRPINVGDKLSSRHGNKGIVAKLELRADMPYCVDGLTPDAIVNAHSIPTRMAVNQIIECMLGCIAARLGGHIDATVFRKHDIAGRIKALADLGIQYGGHRRMYCGRTGEWIDTLMFIGPTTYQRLQKFVIDEHYATRTGPTSASTRQPLDGKNNDGGLRLGEMEKDVLCAHGCMRTLFAKFYTDSDGIDIPICRICGHRAVVNEKMGIYKCKFCGDCADIVNVSSSWVANLFMSEAAAMNAQMTFELAPHIYTRQQ